MQAEGFVRALSLPMALSDFHKIFVKAEGHHARASDVSKIRVLALPIKRRAELLKDRSKDLLWSGRNVLVLFDDDAETESESSINIVLSGQEPVRRSRAYLQMAKIASKHRLSSAIAVVTNSAGLSAMISIADISAVPVALVLPEKNDFANDQSIQPLLLEAIDKARLAFGLSDATVADVQSNLGKRLWRITALGEAQSNAAAGNQASTNCNEILAWILESLDDGFPSDILLNQIESSKRLGATVPYIDPVPPKSLHWSMHDHFQALYRLRVTGHQPQFVVDVGASTGFWSHVASHVFPKSRFYLIEPLLERYQRMNQGIYSLHPEYVTIASAAGAESGEAELNVSSDLYSSSFLDGAELSPDRHWDRVRVPVRTLDEISSTFSIEGRGMLKIDVQLGEHLVLDGGMQFLKQVDVICIELSLYRLAPGSKTFFEMVTKLHHLDFEYFDFAGSWRNSRTGQLIQQDAIFMRTSVRDELEWN